MFQTRVYFLKFAELVTKRCPTSWGVVGPKNSLYKEINREYNERGVIERGVFRASELSAVDQA